jgi:hypothetical protein
MKRMKATVGITLGILTVIAAALVPFVLYGLFTKGVAGLGLHVDEMYSGGPKVRTVQLAGYTIEIHRQVSPHMLQREKPFVQIDWKPVSALPPRVSDMVDIDGDGKPDVQVNFEVPKEATALLKVDVASLNPRYASLQNAGKEKLSALIVRVDDAVLVRVPVVQ